MVYERKTYPHSLLCSLVAGPTNDLTHCISNPLAAHAVPVERLLSVVDGVVPPVVIKNMKLQHTAPGRVYRASPQLRRQIADSPPIPELTLDVLMCEEYIALLQSPITRPDMLANTIRPLLPMSQRR